MGGSEDLDVTQRLAELDARLADGTRRIDALEARVETNREVIRELRGEGLVARGRADNLEAALRSSRVIGAAVGIVMAERRCTQEEEFEVLRKASQDHNVKLRDVAEALVHTGDVASLRTLVRDA
jgi:tetrahydromethanopterin S-methyltransferase subunit F